jgi:cadmium resistance protein CadD (predicted permease)
VAAFLQNVRVVALRIENVPIVHRKNVAAGQRQQKLTLLPNFRDKVSLSVLYSGLNDGRVSQPNRSWLSLIGLGITAFAATNIDDIFVLMMFFSALSIPPRYVVLGQYLGIGLLVAISAIASLLSLVVPPIFIGLMGVLPIAIGIKKLLELRKKKNEVSKQALESSSSSISFITVAAVTFANGGDNIGVYTPLFATNNSSTDIIALSTVFMIMTALWCTSAYFLVNHPLVASQIQRIGHIVLPFIFVGLGIFILAEAFLHF